MKEIGKIISIGSNCIAADFTNTLNIREKGPVDNIANFNIWNSQLLFSGEIYKRIFKNTHLTRSATDFEINKFNYNSKVFTFVGNFSIVHNDFNNPKFQRSLKKRIHNFLKFYRKSKKRSDYWYIYSLNYDDFKLNESHFKILISLLPKCCVERLICLGIRGKNPLFGKYFNYYIELEDESSYKWNNTKQANDIANKLYEAYQLRIKIK